MTFTREVRLRFALGDVRELRRGRHALVALLAIGAAACGGSDSAAPPMPGSILVTTETSGFAKDQSYELFVDGESVGAIGADDQLMVSELDPATYEVQLGDVADNCTVESASVPVAAEATSEVSLSVACTFSDPDVYTLRFVRDRPNLDTGALTDCLFGICSTTAEWDLYVHYNSQGDPQSVIRQNQATGVEIAHLPGVTLAGLTEDDVATAVFTTALVADPFDSARVILIRTDLGAVYALGNPVENTVSQTLVMDAALIASP